MDEIRQKTTSVVKSKSVKDTLSDQYQPLENNNEYILNIQQEATPQKGNAISMFTKRIKRGSRILMISGIAAIIIYGITNTSKSVDTSPEAEAAIETHMSTTLAAGTRLMAKDDGNYVGGDLVITHTSNNDETTIYVWDYAAEDGDYVQVIVNGTPLTDPFMIKNKPVSFKVPTVGEIEVLGIRDGGGGITYAVYYDMNHTTYFNGMNQDGSNLYTLIRE